MKVQNDYVLISKTTWEDLKNNPSFNELLEIIEDREDFLEAQKNDKSKGIELNEFLKSKGI